MPATTPRTPPKKLRDDLRAEVGFGCPVRGCGSPYLTWHHFDPPWAPSHEHRHEGMVALCLQHHKEADHGAFTDDQLRRLKREPYLRDAGRFPSGSFNWRRKQIVLNAGGIWHFEPYVLLQDAGRNIVWLSEDVNGNISVNMDLFDRDGQLAFSMRDNDWLVHLHVNELECPPGAKSLRLTVGEQDVKLDLAFRQLTQAQFKKFVTEHCRKAERAGRAWMKKHWPPSPHRDAILSEPSRVLDSAAGILKVAEDCVDGAAITLCTLSGRIVWPVEIDLSRSMTTLPGNNVISNSVVRGGSVAIAIN